ncbi:hypothetical protein H5407_20610 [Mitsuaria sp. WAJ17]|uniref:hypothetical protein n=1 Tax=Mitsuaria sp. WAJ17 TaxID=2761452 RepID=UPI001602AC95|nr:hypothetical protein [Mitsuaria sp. WAJ17]MBB2487645.1 hypothetical protein [Mitsuaria sp. WAJ17]
MSSPPDPPLSRTPSPDTALEQQILEVELRMLQRRRALLGSWNEVEHGVGQLLAPRAWLWPLALGAAGGFLLGLLWQRGGRGRGTGGRAPGGAYRGEAHAHRGAGALASVLALAGPWLRSQLKPMVHQWLRPTVLEAAEALMLALLGGVLKKPSPRGGDRPHDPASAGRPGSAAAAAAPEDTRPGTAPSRE